MKLRCFIIFGIILSCLVACTRKSPQDNDKLIVKDYFNRTISIPRKLKRVLPLYYVQAEIICALGAKTSIVGIGRINNNSSLFLKSYFPDILELPQVGQSDINYEKIVSLNPDVVFAGTEKPSIEKLEQLGYLVVATYPKTMKDITDEIMLYGNILGKQQQAHEIYESFNKIYQDMATISSQIPTNKRPKIYYIRTDALTSLGGNVQSEIIKFAGGQLLTEGLGDNATSLQMSLEDIYRYNPDIIIIRDRASINPDDIYNDENWQLINAVKNRKIFKEHAGWTEYRLETIFGIIEKAKWIQPKLFKDFNPDNEYNKFIQLVRDNNR